MYLGGSRERTVLSTLLLEAEHVVPIDRLIDAVWGEDPPATARGQVQFCISALRRRTVAACGVDPIETRRPGYVIHLGEHFFDLHRFEEKAREGRLARAGGDPPKAVRLLRLALDLWRGPPLADIDSTLLRRGVNHLDERRLTVIGESLECALLAGEHHEVIGELRTLVADRPLHEHFWALLMTALHSAGRQAEALDAYRAARRVLRDELGIEPGGELRDLHEALLSGAYRAPRFTPPAAVSRTRDESVPSAPEDSETEPTAAESAHTVPESSAAVRVPLPAPDPEPMQRTPSLLPTAIPDFIGREEVVASVLEQLSRGEGNTDRAVPISVIVGPGGAGKTTLAVHTAHRLADRYPDGQLFAELRTGNGPVSPSDILERFLRALGVSGPNLPRTLDERAELFRDLVGDRRLLIVLDDAMTERQVNCLLPGTAGCAVLVTSRRRLTGLPARGRVELGALSEPGAIDLLTRFVGEERVAADPEGVADLCRFSGRLPLALRICAARLAARPHWTVADLVDRLYDESRRLDELGHGEMTVRASISLTYDSLPDDARLLFRRLALLDVPSFAAWVGSPLLEVDAARAHEALEVLTEAYLIDATPVPGGQVRYSFHDIMRPFAQERLVEESAEERTAALERWLGSLLSLTGEAHRREYAGGFLERRSSASRWRLPDRLVGRLLANPLSWYEQERTSIVAAVRQAAVSGLVEHSWDLALSAVTLFEAHCYFDDWRETHEVALKAACRAGDERGEAAMRYSLGSLHMFEQSTVPARRQFDQAYTLYERSGDEHGAALVLRNMAYLDRLSGDLVSAQRRWESSLDTFQLVGDRIAEAHVLHNLARMWLDSGHADGALKLLSRAQLICRTVGNRRVSAQVENRMGELHLLAGRLDEAQTAYGSVLESVRDSRDRVGECYALLGLAAVERRRGRLGAAARLLEQALATAGSSGARMAESHVAQALGEVLLASDPAAALEYAQRALRGFEEIGAPLQRARAVVLRGRVHAMRGDGDSARDDWRTARSMLRAVNTGGGRTSLEDEIARLLEPADPPTGAMTE
ncbi:AfsR/SARP family transcriptional regulator [Streptomyces alkaliphilus]|uniref:AfsR/SARP family transcriptional regulator n=1 Tax=Streptomyces alkaliphilus TaxID=1472722 RepID=UPI0015F7E4E5|nr:BTAD domain-containing putative transcriptional regulator [Streptomyces alkaliphilus]